MCRQRHRRLMETVLLSCLPSALLPFPLSPTSIYDLRPPPRTYSACRADAQMRRREVDSPIYARKYRGFLIQKHMLSALNTAIKSASAYGFCLGSRSLCSHRTCSCMGCNDTNKPCDDGVNFFIPEASGLAANSIGRVFPGCSFKPFCTSSIACAGDAAAVNSR